MRDPIHRPQVILLISGLFALGLLIQVVDVITIAGLSEYDVRENLRETYLQAGIRNAVPFVFTIRAISLLLSLLVLVGLWRMKQWSIFLFSSLFCVEFFVQYLGYVHKGVFLWWVSVMVLGAMFYNYSEMD